MGLVCFLRGGKVARASGREVRVDRVVAGGGSSRVSVLRGQHGARVMYVGMAALDVTRLVSIDEEGTLCEWEVDSAECTLKICKTNVVAMRGKFVVLARMDKWKLFQLESISEKEGLKTSKMIYKSKHAVTGFDAVGDRVIVCYKRTAVVCDKIDDGFKATKVSHDAKITCVALHPSGDLFILGDTTGKIVVCRMSNGDFCNPVKTVMHWHPTSVASLAFSNDGTHFISGGHERVLVEWQLETGKRAFTPRVGSEIVEVVASPDGNKYGVLLKSGKLRIFDSQTREFEADITSLNGPKKEIRRKSPTEKRTEKNIAKLALKFDPHTKTVVTQNTPGVLDFVDVEKEKQLGTVDVSMQNIIAETDRSMNLLPYFVSHVAFDQWSGQRMATVEMRTKDQQILKFWKRVKGKGLFGAFELATEVRQPHERPVVDVLFGPGGKMCVTAARDSTFKVWTLKDSAKDDWQCRSVGFFRKTPISCISLSDDGSLLVLVYEGNLITLWDPMENALIKVLAHQKGVSIKRIGFHEKRKLVSVSENGELFFWDLFDGIIEWSLRLGTINAIGFHGSRFSIVAASKMVLLFESNPLPKIILVDERFSDEDEAISVEFRPSFEDFVIKTRNGTVLRAEKDPSEKSEAFNMEAEVKRTGYSVMNMTDEAKQEVDGGVRDLATNDTSVLDMLDVFPSSELPSISKLFDATLSTSKKRRKPGSSHLTAPTTTNAKKKQKTGDFLSDTTVHISDDDDLQQQHQHARLHDKALETNMMEFFRNKFNKK